MTGRRILAKKKKKERKTFLRKVKRGGDETPLGELFASRPPLLLLLSNTFSFVIRKDTMTFFFFFYKSFTLLQTRRRLYFHATPFALNEFHSANRRESLPSSTGFLLFTRFLPPSRQFPWLFFNFHAYFLPPLSLPVRLMKSYFSEKLRFFIIHQVSHPWNRIKPARLDLISTNLKRNY